MKNLSKKTQSSLFLCRRKFYTILYNLYNTDGFMNTMAVRYKTGNYYANNSPNHISLFHENENFMNVTNIYIDSETSSGRMFMKK